MKRPDNVQTWIDRQEALPRDKLFALIEFDLLDYIKALEKERDNLQRELNRWLMGALIVSEKEDNNGAS